MDLFCLISGQFLGSIGQITKQGDVIANSVTAPLKGLVNTVTGGAWKGDGANRFPRTAGLRHPFDEHGFISRARISAYAAKLVG